MKHRESNGNKVTMTDSSEIVSMHNMCVIGEIEERNGAEGMFKTFSRWIADIKPQTHEAWGFQARSIRNLYLYRPY